MLLDDDVSNASDEDAESIDADISTQGGSESEEEDDDEEMGSEEDEVSDEEEEEEEVDGMSIDSRGSEKRKGQKRKFEDFDEELDGANQSLRALKRLAGARLESEAITEEPTTDGILSNEDFQRIKELKVSHHFYTINIIINLLLI